MNTPVEEATEELGLLEDDAPDDDDGVVFVVVQALPPLLLLLLLMLLLRMWVLLGLGLLEELVVAVVVTEEEVWLPLWGFVYRNFKMVKPLKEHPPYEVVYSRYDVLLVVWTLCM